MAEAIFMGQIYSVIGNAGNANVGFRGKSAVVDSNVGPIFQPS
ncbi:hypothetical protein SPWS13_2164 [Shewanella putrefaciens]|nr:hypothetical protein SPWS13_2164 [Shewanella putrefaciens]